MKKINSSEIMSSSVPLSQESLVDAATATRLNSRQDFEAEVAAKPDSASVYRDFGIWLYSSNGQFAEAWQQLSIAYELHPEDIGTLFHRAHVSRKLARFSDSERDLLALIELAPRHAKAWRRLGELRSYYLDEPVKAIEAFEQARTLDPSEIQVQRGLAAAQERAGAYAEAQSSYDVICESPVRTDSDLQAYAQFLLQRGGDPVRAGQIILELLDRQPSSKDLLLHLAGAGLAVVRLPDSADREDFLERAVQRLRAAPGLMPSRAAVIVTLMSASGKQAAASLFADRCLSLFGTDGDLEAARGSLAYHNTLRFLSEGRVIEALEELKYAVARRTFLISLLKPVQKSARAAFDLDASQIAEIVGHLDDKIGREATNKWLAQLVPLSATTSGQTLSGLLKIFDSDLAVRLLELWIASAPKSLSDKTLPELSSLLAFAERSAPSTQLHALHLIESVLDRVPISSTSKGPIEKLRQRLYLNKVRSLRLSGRSAEALSLLRRAVASKRKDIEFVRQLCELLIELGDHEDIPTIVRGMLGDVNKSGAVIEATQILARAGYMNLAISLLEADVSLVSRRSSVAQLAKLYTLVNKPEQVRAVFARSLVAPSATVADVRFNVGAMLALGRTKDALRALTANSGSDPDVDLAHIGARLLSAEADEAEAVFPRAIENILKIINTEELNPKSSAFGALERLSSFAVMMQGIFSNAGRDLKSTDSLNAVVIELADRVFASPGLVRAGPLVVSSLLNVSRLYFLLGRGKQAASLLEDRFDHIAREPKDAVRAAKLLNGEFNAAGKRFASAAMVGVLKKTPTIATTSQSAQLLEPTEVLLFLDAADQLNDDAAYQQAAGLGADLIRRSMEVGSEGQAHLVSLASRLNAACPEHYNLAANWISRASDKMPSDPGLLSANANTLRVVGDMSAAALLLRRAAAASPLDTLGYLALADAEQANGDLNEALISFQTAKRLALHDAWQALGDPRAVELVLRISSRIEALEFAISTSEVVARVPPPSSNRSRGVVIACSYSCQATACLAALPVVELRRRGFDAIYLASGTTDAGPSGHPEIDAFAGIFTNKALGLRSKQIHPLQAIYDWHIDWENRRVEALGINFYQPLYERLNRLTRRYRFDVTLPGLAKALRANLLMLDRALYVCEEIRVNIASKGIPVRFVSANWQYPPYAAYRIYCDDIGHKHNMQFVAVGPGYENYYSNLGSKFSATCAVVNTTINRKTRAPFIAVKKNFDQWYDRLQCSGISFDDQVKQWIGADRSGARDLSVEAAAVRDRVMQHRAAGGSTIGIFGKIVYDLTVPYTGGPAHRDMADFLNHTIESARGAQTLVLIKPHPHELRYEIAGRPNEFFLDMIDVEVPSNVILLGHRWFNIRDMIPMLDLGILWNGTTGLELGASGIPVVMCDDWGLNDYPVGHAAPQNRDHYAEIIRNPAIVQMEPDHALKCAALLKYMSTEDVMHPYPFAQRGVTNVNVGPPRWNTEELNRYFELGDAHVSALADKFLFSNIGVE